MRACWAALWTTRARRYMATHELDPADTAMAVLIQPLVARPRIRRRPQPIRRRQMLLSATWGLGSAIAQGEVMPDRFVLTREGLLSMIAGRKDHEVGCLHRAAEPTTQVVTRARAEEPCLSDAQAMELGHLLRRAEDLMGMPVEIEWALDDAGFKLLQARPLHIQPATVPDEIWLQPNPSQRPRRRHRLGHRTRLVINCECEMSRIAPGDILITKVAGPALSHILPQVAGVVTELGGSTSHLASLARERGIPMVLGVLDATRRIPNGSTVAVDGVAGVVRWMN